jgi:hypothetical protein
MVSPEEMIRKRGSDIMMFLREMVGELGIPHP